MKPVNPQLKVYAKPLYEALTLMQRWIEREQEPHIILAAHAFKELKRAGWPTHLKVSKKAALGRRVSTRASHGDVVAYYPETTQEVAGQPSLICVVKGQAALDIANYQLQCQMGDLVFIPQGVPKSSSPHLAENSESGQCDLLWIRPGQGPGEIHCWICHSEPGLHESGPQYGTCEVDNILLGQLFQGLCEELQSNNQSELIYYLLASVITLLQREMENGRSFLPRHHHADHHEPLTPNAGHPMERACSYIDEHIHQPLTINHLARHTCISPTLFRSKFRRHTGQNFHQYLTARRMARASSLLRETDLPVNAISGRVGLHYSQLRRLYYQHFGCTPGEFRKDKEEKREMG